MGRQGPEGVADVAVLCGPRRSLEELHSREVEANAGLLAALEERKVRTLQQE